MLFTEDHIGFLFPTTYGTSTETISSWGFIIHGGIDGQSRLCVFLKCGTSNKSQVVMEHFMEAVDTYGCPLRVRSDYGTENVEVARYMIETRGPNRGSFPTDKSTHNQRIERLWRDVRECVTSIFSDIFHFMEDEGIANRYDELHILAMHYVFCPRINRALEEFREQWNNHPMRTSQNRSASMLWYEGMLRNPTLVYDGPVEFNDSDEPVPNITTNNNVQVHELSLQLTPDIIEILNNQTDPLVEDEC
ncbi:uncharacterized protein LOC106154373 [Lingula anatina]|uniref:Uncharacterized protein LOC106154373 n=1 Tax=Lingula anatina TaxID=7574 RepID=A0A1S3HDN8_LINAN|nr:uncharacterized protein LOC106154373 [Lingula anatina]|eukprot:XP_013384162.1 uncharacterized protein LOC106154373 [Lingula anatina]